MRNAGNGSTADNYECWSLTPNKRGRHETVYYTERDVQDLLFQSVAVDAVVTVSSSQALFRRKRQLEHRGPTHPNQTHLPGAVSAKGFPNTLIQVNHTC